MANDLPANWTKHVDDDTGNIYYFNTKTNESSWDFPIDLSLNNEDDIVNWSEERTKNGDIYYSNSITGEVRWDPPNGFVKLEVVDLSPSDIPDNWECIMSDNHEEYYYNHITEETQWEKPMCIEMLEQQILMNDVDFDGDHNINMSSKDSNTESSVTDDSISSSIEEKPEDLYSFIKNMEDIPDNIVELISKLVESYSLETFAESHFNYERKGLLRSKSAVDKLMSWGADPLTSSLLLHDDSDTDYDFNDTCIQMFRYVQSFMRDYRDRNRSSTVETALEILMPLFSRSNENGKLTDEVLAQICKQTTNNPSLDSNDRGWALLLLILCSFPPSEEFLPYLLSYCVFNASEEVPGKSANFARKAIIACTRSYRLGRRIDPPSPMEIEAIVRDFPINVRVNFIDGKYIFVQIKPWTTCDELTLDVVKKLGIKDGRPFALYEVASQGSSNNNNNSSLSQLQNNLLAPSDRVVDIEGSWYATQSEAMKKSNEFEITNKDKDKKDQDKQLVMYFLFKIGYFFPIEESSADPAYVELAYIQARSDVLTARYPTTLQCAYLLAALMLQEEYGDMIGDFDTEDDGNNNNPTFAIENYISADHVNADEEALVRSEILKRYSKMNGFTRLDTQLTYLDYVKSLRVYGSVFFLVEPQNNKAYPAEVILGINGRNIVVTNSDTQEYLSVIDIADVISVSYSAKNFIMVIAGDEDNQQDRLYFITPHGREINYFVSAYIEFAKNN